MEKRKFKKKKSFGDKGEERGLPVRKKACRFCVDKELRIDYKDAKALRPYISEGEKITPSRISGLCSYHQRRVTEAIKRARILGIVSFSPVQKALI
ncbi:MAG: 30S ribosomal protein S18 [Deltaproteobacteria bacterium]|nr:30S ribosomal protein S18 [Deltaproteobacteria bacterium]MDZ4224979.1 30S ribosomal protein S18 [bacterium]